MELSSLAARLQQCAVIPVLRLATRAATEYAIDCLIEAGFQTVEITLTTPDAIALIEKLRGRDLNGVLLGAGTVLDLDAARRCLDAGADYLVSPALVAGLAQVARDAGRAALVGAFTPGEVLSAWHDGAEVVKIFPAATGGPAHLQALHAVYPEIPLCPTGGVSHTNMLDYFKAGASMVGVGNNIVDQTALAAGDRAGVIRHARAYLDLARTLA